LGSAATERNRHSSRHCKHIQLFYHPNNGSLIGINSTPYLLDGMVFISGKPGSNTKGDKYVNYSPPFIFPLLIAGLPTIKNSEEFKITNTQKDSYLASAALTYTKDLDLIRDYAYISESLLECGRVSESTWHTTMAIVAACIHLQSISIVGSESTIISSATKSSVAIAESLVGLPVGSISSMLLKKKIESTDRQINNSMGSGSADGPVAMVDCKPLESRALVDAFCSTIYSRCFKSLLKMCSNTENVILDGVDKSRVVHLVDTPGWEMLKVDDVNNAMVTSNLQQCLIHYFEERIHNSLYLKSVFVDEIKSFAAEGVDISSELHFSIPDFSQLSELFEKPTTGLFSLFEESGLSQNKVDEKVLCERIVNLHGTGNVSSGKVALVIAPPAITQSQQSKTVIKTIFLVRHSFVDIVYDCEGFVLQNKTYTVLLHSNQITQLLQSSTIPMLSGIDAAVTVIPGPPPPPGKSLPPPLPPPSKQQPINNATTSSKSTKVDKATLSAGLLMSKAKIAISTLVSTLQSVPYTNQFFCLCVSPNPYLVTIQ